ncbi:MAG TPA: hypothetical protein VF815_11550 [Myxococcaceae bacterium]|jgi:hypothetical protein
MSKSTSLSPLLLTVALASSWGCTKEEAPPPQEDRTLAKLRAEAERVDRGGAPSGPPTRGPAPSEDPNSTLAGVAAGEVGANEEKLRLPESNATVHVGTLAVKLVGIESSQAVQGSGKVGLATEERFLRVELIAQNVDKAVATVGLEGARVVDAAGKEFGLARDAQIVAGTRQLRREWPAGERAEVVLLFELPPASIGEGLTLVLPSTSGDVRLALL